MYVCMYKVRERERKRDDVLTYKKNKVLFQFLFLLLTCKTYKE